MAKVDLAEILEALAFHSDESTALIDRLTGDVVFTSDEYESLIGDDDIPHWMREPIEKAKLVRDNPDRFVELPTQYEIDEYSIMKSFCESRENPEHVELLSSAIRGRGAFRRFKDSVHSIGMADEWHRYREEALLDIAFDWCREISSRSPGDA
jgi:hypothetical protein